MTHTFSRRHIGWMAAFAAVMLGVALVAPGRAEAQVAPVPPIQAPPFVGVAPKPGEIALMLTSRAVAPSELSAGLTSAGCSPTVLAVTVGGQWLVFVTAAPTFVNAPFAAALPSLAGGTGFFVRCADGPRPDGLSLAPIEQVEIARGDVGVSTYVAVVRSGLPSGCAKFERVDVTRSGDTFTLTVLNRVTVPPSGACTAIYGIVTNRVALSGDFIVGRQYSVTVNGQTTTFTAGASIPVVGPPAPTNVRLTGSLPDLMTTVPAGEGERGRVTVMWDSVAAVTGFRVYQRDCGGVLTGTPIEVPGGERQYGPLQPCRPGGNVGVSALNSTGESVITWVK